MKKSLVIVLGILLFLPLASAGFFDFLTGKVASLPQDLNVSVGNSNPEIRLVSLSGGLVTPVEAGTNFTTVYVSVYDHDGAGDVNRSSVTINATASVNPSNEDVRGNNSCTYLNDGDNGKSANFSCVIDMYYFDNATTWNLGVAAADNDSVNAYNTTESFTYSELTAFVRFPGNVTWEEVLPGNTDISSSVNVTMNNTGNDYFGANNVLLNATDLVGEIDVARVMTAPSFEVGSVGCNDDAMVNGTFTGLSTITLPKGNLSEAVPVSQEEVVFCVSLVNETLTKQVYSTSTRGSWTLKVI